MIDKDKELTVLSLFDGMSCGRIALEELNIPVKKYYASEIDKYAIQQSSMNFPDIVHLGSVTGVDVSKLEHIDLLIGGSPCFVAGTKIICETGIKNIEDVTCDDMVLTHTGKYRKVLATGGTIKETYNLVVDDRINTKVTGNHPYYVRSIVDDYDYSLSDPTWKPVSDLMSVVDFVGEHVYDGIQMGSDDFIIDEIVWRPIRSISKTNRTERVYNLEIETDNSYTANGFIVHNCQSFSFAGKRKGMATKCEIEILSLEHYLELKENNFEFEGQSYLFWEYMRILNDIRKYNPEVKFLLENVEMGKKWESVLTKAIGVPGIHINAALVSAQNRRRIYWTNIGTQTIGEFRQVVSFIEQPVDRGILLRDVLEPEVDEKYYLKVDAGKVFGSNFRGSETTSALVSRRTEYGKQIRREYESGEVTAMRKEISELQPRGDGKTNCLTSVQKDNCIYEVIKLDKQLNPKKNQDKASCFCAGAHSGGNHSDMDLICVAMRGRNPENPSDRTAGSPTVQRLEPCSDVGKTNCLTTVGKDNLILAGNLAGGKWDKIHESSRRVYSTEGKSPTVLNMGGGNQHPKIVDESPLMYQRPHGNNSGGFVGRDDKTPSLTKSAWEQNNLLITSRVRRLTPTECSRLQTIPDWYVWKVSNTQQYRMLGNGWCVEVIKHIFSYLYKTPEPKIIDSEELYDGIF